MKYSPLFSFMQVSLDIIVALLGGVLAVPLTWYFGAGKRTTPIV
jgi:hypothetical protein